MEENEWLRVHEKERERKKSMCPPQNCGDTPERPALKIDIDIPQLARYPFFVTKSLIIP